MAARALQNGEPVWHGCDTPKMGRDDLGVWDAELYDFARLYDTDFTMTKAERLLYGQSKMVHAMLFTGVDVVDGRTRRWRVENSWGKERGNKGFYLMGDSWFDEYMYAIAVRKDYLPEELVAVLDEDPIVLPPWDPMGALAG